MKNLFWLLTLFTISLAENHETVEAPRTFEVDYENNVFLKDGKPFTYASGEIHYFRIPKIYWQDRLKKAKLAGLNAISTYIEWSLHEPSPGLYHFKQEADVAEFIKMAEKEGLLVIVRPGPYICAERDFGGYPSWLLTVNPKMKLRTSDPSHTFFVTRYFKHLMGQLQPLFYGNGGPIIMVQVENEYGSYPVTDSNYLLWLRDLYRSYVGNSAVLFTTDGPAKDLISRGKIPGVFATIDFGPTKSDVKRLFQPLRKLQPNGPLVNSEFYVGWLTYWGENFTTTEIPPIVSTMKQMLANNISFNCYMFHGGTNFGFTSGSGSSDHFLADITSYDYDAPISEAGDLTDKFFAIKDTLKEKYPSEEVPENLKVVKKGNYGELTLKPLSSLLKSPIGREPVQAQFPITMEDMAQRYGYIAYTTQIPRPTKDPSVLQVNIRDRALVLIDGVEVSTLQYTVINETPLPPNIAPGKNLTLIVENMGRRNYKLLSDCTKGIISNATLDGQLLQDWTMVGYPLTYDNLSRLDKFARGSIIDPNFAFPDPTMTLPGFFIGYLQIPDGEEPLDTFIDMTDWGKGVVFINNHNIGRYWHIGPQKTLYVPSNLLLEYPYRNRVTILEFHFTSPNKTVTFTTEPDFGLKPKPKKSIAPRAESEATETSEQLETKDSTPRPITPDQNGIKTENLDENEDKKEESNSNQEDVKHEDLSTPEVVS